ncbi:matrix metalloproteinase-17 [Brachyhypopomus gauderio]|uniref:matrix metalloproteinase-17 n=1 Tax=Brachyhypopomus gauderio TaxID=698409 RepID=UPI00404100D2
MNSLRFFKCNPARNVWIIYPEMILVPILWVLSQAGAAPSVTSEQMDMGVDWLSKFGYLPSADPVTGQLQTKEALTKAIKAMQRFGGLEETGVLDQATLGLMRTPRCSLPDVSEAELGVGRRRRSLPPQNKWKKRHLSWRVRTFPKESALLGRDTVRALMYYALKVWSDIAPLNFHEVAGNEADIHIDFTKADHNDGYPFDGPGGTVAHAFFPGERFTAGDTHFDDDEAWTFRSPDSHGMDLFAVAVHEFGHAIGLAHTSAMESIMRPYYHGPVGDPLKYDLPYEDKVRVWQLYGVRDSVSHTVRPDDPSHTADPPVLLDLPGNRSTMPPAHDAPDRCTSHFDAVAQIRGEAFFFKGKYFWRLTRERHLVSLRPAQIQRFWRGLPANLDGVDAVYERPGDHKIVFFKGVKYWVFKDNIVEEGYPRPISDFGLPMDGVDAVFVWLHNDKTYFFKDDRYWRYDDHLRSMDLGYPKDTALWKGVPPQLDDAMRWSDSASYFFKGKEYWRVEGSDMEVEAGYPRSIGRDWLMCTDMQSDSPETRNSSGAVRLPGPHQADHAENGFEVCSCSSDSGSPATLHLRLSAPWLLPPLWTLARALVPAAL